MGISLGLGLLAGRQGGWDVVVVFALGTVIGAVGLVDDFRTLSARLRLVLLLLVGLLAGLALSGPIPALFAAPLMALWTASYVNAFNFMDGINGISGISGLVAGVAYLAMGIGYDSTSLVALGAALSGASLAFLPFNLPKARVFLGDVGSYSMGFIIASSAWLAWANGAPLLLALAPSSVYLVDTGVTLMRRMRAGEPLAEAHRHHTYQRLVDGGWSHAAVSALVGLTAATVTVMVWAGIASGYYSACVLVSGAILAGYMWLPKRAFGKRRQTS